MAVCVQLQLYGLIGLFAQELGGLEPGVGRLRPLPTAQQNSPTSLQGRRPLWTPSRGRLLRPGAGWRTTPPLQKPVWLLLQP